MKALVSRRAVLSAIAAFGLLGGVAHAQEIVIRYASASPDVDPAQKPILWVADEVAKRTDGRVKFELFLGGSLVKDQDILQAVGDGLVDMGKIYTVSYAGQWPVWTLFNMPFASSAPYVAIKTVRELRERFPQFTEETDKYNIDVLGVLATGGTGLTTKQPLRTLGDLRGKKIRARGVVSEVIAAGGGVPISMPFNEVYEALSKGVIDGTTDYIVSVGNFRHNEVADYYNYVELGQLTQAEVVNKDFWANLPDDVKQLLTELMAEAETRFVEDSAKVAVEEVEKLSGKTGSEQIEFIRFPAEEMEKWRAQSPDMYGEWVKQNGGGEEFQAIVDAYMDALKRHQEEGEKLGFTSMW